MKYSIRCSLLPAVNKDGSHTVRMRVSWTCQRVTHYLSSHVMEADWDARTSMPKRTARKALKEVNELIAAVDSLFDRCHLEQRVPSVDEVKGALGDINTSASSSALLLVDAMKMLSTDSTLGDSWADNTRANYQTLCHRLIDWRPQQTLEGFTSADMRAFMDYCFRRGMVNTTVQKFLKQLRWTLRTAAQKGMCSPSDAVTFRPRYRSDSEHEVVYLTKEELQALMNANVSDLPHLERVRDIFLFCCFSGLRYSDAAKLKRADIREGFIQVITKKTSDSLRIELNDITSSILDKYRTDNPAALALPVISNQRMNTYLKELGKRAGIDEPVKRVWWVRSERHEEVVPKWKALTSHCGRKTFVVSALSLDIASEVVMKWTGHKDHKTMKPYIAIVDDLKARQMAKFNSLAEFLKK